MDSFKEQVRRGFQACKDDINQVSSQQSQLNSGLLALEQENKLLKNQIRELRDLIYNLQEKQEIFPQNNHDISQKSSNNKNLTNIEDEQYQKPLYQPTFYLNNQIQDLNNNPNFNQNNNIIVKQKEEIKSSIPINPHEALREFKVKANKKEILKEKILEFVGERGIFLNELKFMFVDYYKYSSKATFYNYLKEVELEKSIRIERINNKNMVFLEVHKKEELFRKQII